MWSVMPTHLKMCRVSYVKTYGKYPYWKEKSVLQEINAWNLVETQ